MRIPVFIPWRTEDRKYLGLTLVLAITLGLLVGTLYVAFTTVRVDGDSMLPALRDEDRVLVTKGYPTPRRGDIISVTMVDGSERVGALKRVVALPGDTVAIDGDVAYVNGEPSTVAPDALIGGGGQRTDPLVVPAGMVFALGDNRPVSLDSRHVGPIPLLEVQGKVVAVILPVTRFMIID